MIICAVTSLSFVRAYICYAFFDITLRSVVQGVLQVALTYLRPFLELEMRQLQGHLTVLCLQVAN